MKHITSFAIILSKNWYIWVMGMTMLVTMLIALPAGAVYASAKEDICKNAGNTWDGTKCTTKAGEVTIDDAITAVVNVLSMIVGVVSVVMIIVGGFKFVTSGGDPAATKSAKNTILYAVVGLIVVAVAQSIVWFVLQSAVATPTPASPVV